MVCCRNNKEKTTYILIESVTAEKKMRLLLRKCWVSGLQVTKSLFLLLQYMQKDFLAACAGPLKTRARVPGSSRTPAVTPLSKLVTAITNLVYDIVLGDGKYLESFATVMKQHVELGKFLVFCIFS